MIFYVKLYYFIS